MTDQQDARTDLAIRLATAFHGSAFGPCSALAQRILPSVIEWGWAADAAMAWAEERERGLRALLSQATATLQAMHPTAASDLSDAELARLYNATMDALGDTP